jgi:hypothetical protein
VEVSTLFGIIAVSAVAFGGLNRTRIARARRAGTHARTIQSDRSRRCGDGTQPASPCRHCLGDGECVPAGRCLHRHRVPQYRRGKRDRCILRRPRPPGNGISSRVGAWLRGGGRVGEHRPRSWRCPSGAHDQGRRTSWRRNRVVGRDLMTTRNVVLARSLTVARLPRIPPPARCAPSGLVLDGAFLDDRRISGVSRQIYLCWRKRGCGKPYTSLLACALVSSLKLLIWLVR